MFMAYFVCVCVYGGWLCCSVEGLSVFMAYFVGVYGGWLCCSVEGLSVFMAYFVCVYGG